MTQRFDLWTYVAPIMLHLANRDEHDDTTGAYRTPASPWA